MKTRQSVAARWAGIIHQQESSGLSIAEFCRRRDLALPTLYAWRRRLRGSAAPVAEFVELKVTPAVERDGGTPGLEVLARGGRAVLVRRGFDRQLLRELLTALEGLAWSACQACPTTRLRSSPDYHRLANPCPAGLIAKSNEAADRRRPSRALDAAEVVFLLASGLPLYRRTYYTLALYTGLRWRELRRLMWADADIDRLILTVQASQSKNGKAAELPIIIRVAKVLRRWRAKSAGDTSGQTPIFTHEPRIYTWKADLARARTRWIARGSTPEERAKRATGSFLAFLDERGQQADRKAARLTFGTALKRAGVDLRDAQRLMRHSDPKLTSNIYTDARLVDLRRAADLLSTTNQPETAKHGVSKRKSA